MNENEKALAKHFAGVLKQYAKQGSSVMSSSVLKYLSRKDLIAILSNKPKGKETTDLVVLENEELLSLIGNELCLIAYFSALWSKEDVKQVPKEKILKDKKND